MNQAFLQRVDDTVNLSGFLSYDNVDTVYQQGEQLIQQAQQLTFDLSAVERSDMAGVALLVEWLRLAKRTGKSVLLQNIPSQGKHIIQVSGLASILAEQQ